MPWYAIVIEGQKIPIKLLRVTDENDAYLEAREFCDTNKIDIKTVKIRPATDKDLDV